MKKTIIKSIICIACLVSGMAVEAQTSEQKDGPVIHTVDIQIYGGEATKLERVGKGVYDLGIVPIDWKGAWIVSNVGDKPLQLKSPRTSPYRYSRVKFEILSYPKKEILPGLQDTILFSSYGYPSSFGNGSCSITLISNASNMPKTTYSFVVIDPLDFAVIERDGKKGGVNLNNQVVIPFEYEILEKTYYNPKEDESIESVLIYGKKNGKYAILDRNNKAKGDFEYDSIYFSKNRYGDLRAQKKGKWGIVDGNNRVLLPFEYDELGEVCTKGYVKVKKNGKWGILDKDYRVAVSLKYDDFPGFGKGFEEDGAMSAIKDGKWGRIDKNNHVVVPFEFDEEIGRFADGYTRAKKNGKWGIIDKNGKVVIPFEYDWFDYVSWVFKNGSAQAKKNGKWGLVGIDNKIVIPFEYEDVHGGMCDEGYVKVTKNGKEGLVDKMNRIVIPFEYEEISSWDIYHGLRPAIRAKKNGKWGKIDINNKVVVPFEYDKEDDLKK